MATRILLGLAVVGGLGAAIVYSQLRPAPNRVSGFVEADEIRLGSRVGGRVAAVLVKEGQAVSKGQRLLELEPFDLLEREREAERTLAARDAALRRLVAGLRPEEIASSQARRDQLQAQLDLLEAGPREQEISAARARLRAAEAEHKLAQQTYERHSKLVETGALSRDEFDRSSETFQATQAQLAVRQKELELLEAGTREEEKRAAQAAVEQADQSFKMAVKGFREEDIDEAKAARDAAHAALEAVRRQKEELIVSSPLEGRVDSLDLQPGDIVAPGAPVLSIIDSRRLWVRAYIPQNRVALRVGQRLRIVVDSLPDQRLIGTVSFIAHQAEFTPSNVQTLEERSKQVFRIKVQLEDDTPHVRPGMTANVWLDAVDEAP